MSEYKCLYIIALRQDNSQDHILKFNYKQQKLQNHYSILGMLWLFIR